MYSSGYRNYTDKLKKGKYEFTVEPGVYKIVAEYKETWEERENIQITDKNYLWIPFDFSSKRHNQPEIYISELTEQGDEDNLFELGEQIFFRIEIASGNVEKINITLNVKTNHGQKKVIGMLMCKVSYMLSKELNP